MISAQAAAVLREVRQASKPGATLIIHEVVLGTGPRERAKRLADLDFLATGPAGARARTAPELEALLHRAGISTQDLREVPVRSLPSAFAVTLRGDDVGHWGR